MRRARESVEPFARAAALAVQVCPDLREAGGLEVWVQDFPTHVSALWNDFDLEFEGRESHRACQARVATAVASLARAHPGKTLLCSSHGQAIGLLLNRVDTTFGYDDWAAMRMPDLRRLTWHGEGFTWDRSFSLD